MGEESQDQRYPVRSPVCLQLKFLERNLVVPLLCPNIQKIIEMRTMILRQVILIFNFCFVLHVNVMCLFYFYPTQTEEEEEDYEIPQWKPAVDYDPSVYEELKPRLSLSSRYLIVEEREKREERNNNSSGRLTDICPEDDNEYEPIQSPVRSGLPQCLSMKIFSM